MDTIRRTMLIPKDLYEQIRKIAKHENRSLSAQMVHFLSDGVRRYRPPTSAKAEE